MYKINTCLHYKKDDVFLWQWNQERWINQKVILLLDK